MMWMFTCPCCNNKFETDMDVEFIKDNIGVTLDCHGCGALLKIQEDLTVSDFGAELVSIYAECGLSISKEDAIKSYVEIHEESKKKCYKVTVFNESESKFEEYYTEEEVRIIQKFFEDMSKHNVAHYDIHEVQFEKKE